MANNNPGCTCVADQAYAPAQPNQTPAVGSASATNSNGELQQGNQNSSPSFNGTVTKTTSSSPVIQLSGEGGQRLDKKRTPKAITTGHGLPRTVFAGSANQVKHSEPSKAAITGKGLPTEVFPGSSNLTMNALPEIAIVTSPSIDVNAGTAHPGGLPVNVNIR